MGHPKRNLRSGIWLNSLLLDLLELGGKLAKVKLDPWTPSRTQFNMLIGYIYGLLARVVLSCGACQFISTFNNNKGIIS